MGKVKLEKPVVKPNPAAEKAKVAKEQAAKAAVNEAAKSRKKLCTEEIDKQFDTANFEDSFNAFYPNGEFSQAEECARTKELAPGVIIRKDIGLDFYRVQKGDTLDGIKAKLSKFPDFAYMKNLPRNRLTSFNIPASVLQADTWIPLPAEKSTEELTNEQFVANCGTAIAEMKDNEIYGPLIVNLLKTVSVTQVVAMMLACAKTESGTGSLSGFSPFRYENGHKCFSYSVFHILMDGAGLKARQKLGMTEGQVLLPKNSAKLFLAFLIEKSPKNFQKYFPLDKNLESFSSFYNGNWKLAVEKENERITKRNSKKKKGEKLEPLAEDYPTRLGKNYATSKAMLRI